LAWLVALAIVTAPGLALAQVELQVGTVDRATVRVLTVDSIGLVSREGLLYAAPEAGHGTGVIVDPAGLVLTAAHVVEHARIVSVWIPGMSRAFAATVVAADPDLDVAFLWIGGSHPDAVPLRADAPPLRVRQPITAIGYPLDPTQTLPKSTSGVISGVAGRMLQTDVLVNPGNSGGPVVDDQDRLVGIAVARLDPSTAQGISFVVPLTSIVSVYDEELIRRGKLEEARTRHQAGASMDREELAQVAAEIVLAGPDVFAQEAAAFADGTGSMRTWGRLTTIIERSEHPVAMILWAAFSWNAAIHVMWKSRAARVEDMPETLRDKLFLYMNAALDHVDRASKKEPSWNATPFVSHVRAFIEELKKGPGGEQGHQEQQPELPQPPESPPERSRCGGKLTAIESRGGGVVSGGLAGSHPLEMGDSTEGWLVGGAGLWSPIHLFCGREVAGSITLGVSGHVGMWRIASAAPGREYDPLDSLSDPDQKKGVFYVPGEIGARFRLGIPTGVAFGGAYAPGLVVSPAESGFSPRSYSVHGGVFFGDGGFGLSFRSIDRGNQPALRAAELFLEIH